MTTTTPISLDLNQLVNRYAQLQYQSQGPAAFGDAGGTAIYFQSAGSEYRLHSPQCATVNIQLSADAIDAYTVILDNLQAWVTTKESGQKQSDDLARIQAARTELTSGAWYWAYQIDTTIDHVRGTQPDDHARVVVQLLWSAGLNTWLPVKVSMGFTWATSVATVPDSVMKLIGAPNNSHILSYLGDMIELLGDALEVIQVVEYAAQVWNFAVAEFAKMVDDGGRAYFPVVVSEALTRILLSVTPSGASSPGSALTPDLKGLGYCWQANITYSNYTHNNYTYLTENLTLPVTTPNHDQISATYLISLPDLIYLQGGAGTMLSFKVVVDGNPIYAAIMMLLDNQGQLRMATGVVQHHDNTTTTAPPTWGNGPNAANVIDPVVAAFAQGVPARGDDHVEGIEFSLPNVLGTIMTALVQHTRTIGSSHNQDALPPIPLLSVGTTSATFGNDLQRPAVAVASTGYAVCISCDTSGTDALWESTLSSGSTSIIVYSSASSSYQNGQDPAIVAVETGASMVEVHGGNGNNQVYSNVIYLSGHTATMPDKNDGDSYDKGENPAIAAWGTTLYEFHRDGNSDSDELYWKCGALSGSSTGLGGVATAFGQGDNLAATVLPAVNGISTVVVAYVRDGTIYTRCGEATSSGPDFSNSTEQALISGDGPAVVGIGNNVVLLLCHGASPWQDQLQYNIGRCDGASIQWFVAGIGWQTGQFPGAAARTDGAVVVVAEAANSAKNIHAYVANVVMPEGFLG